MPTKFTKTMSRVALAATLFSTMPVNTLSAEAYSSIPSIHLKDGAVKAKAKSISLSKLTLINAKSIKIGKRSFTLSKTHAAFFQKNKAVLKNARIAFAYDAKGKVQSITYVELNAGGKKSKSGTKLERNLVFDGMNGSIAGKVHVNADYVTVQNVKVSDLLVSNAAKSLVRLANVQVKGQLVHGKYVAGSAKQAVLAPKLLLEKSSAGSLELNQKGTIAAIGGKSNIASVAVTANAALEVSKGIKLANVKVQSNVSQLKLTGAIGTLTSQSKDLTVSGTTSIEQVKTSVTKAALQLNVSGHVTQVTSSGNDATLSFGKSADVDKLVLEKSARVTATRQLDVLEVKGGEIALDAPVRQLTTSGETALKLGPSVTIGSLTANASLKVEGGKLIEQLVLGGKATELVLDTATASMTLQTKEDVSVKGTAKVDKVTLDSASDVTLELDRVTKIEETKDNKGTVDTGTTVVDEIKVDESKVVTPPVPPVVPPVTPPGNGGGTTPPGNGGGSNPGNGGGTTPPVLTFKQRLDAFLASDDTTTVFALTEDVEFDGLELKRDKKFMVDENRKLTIKGIVKTNGHKLSLSGKGTVDAAAAEWRGIEIAKTGLFYDKHLKWDGQLHVVGHTVFERENGFELIHADKVIDTKAELDQAIAGQKTAVAASAPATGESTNPPSLAAETSKVNEIWFIRSGEYGLTPNQTIEIGDQKGYYLPIVQDGLTIVGESGTLLYGNNFSENGVWATQNLITVDAKGVTLEGLTIMPKIEVNKAIEILSEDFTLKNSTVKPNTKVGKIADPFDEKFSGSVYFNTGDKETNATIENTVLEKGRITTGGTSKNLTLRLDRVTIDYAGSSVETYAGYYPFKNTIKSKVIANDLKVTASAASAKEMTELVAELPTGAHLALEEGQYTLPKQFVISKGITITGPRAVFSPGEAFKKTGSRPTDNLVSINNAEEAVTLDGLTFRDSHATGVQAYRSKNVTLNNVTSHNNAAAGLIVNGSTVTATGLRTENNAWYGVNVDSGVDVPEKSVFNLTDGTLKEEYEVVSDVASEAKVSVSLPGFTGKSIEKSTKKYWTTKTNRLNGVYVKEANNSIKQYMTVQEAVDAAKAGETVLVSGTQSLKKQLVINKPIRIEGERDGKLVPSSKFEFVTGNDGKVYNPSLNLVSINGVDGDVELKDLTLSDSLRSGLQVYKSPKVKLANVALKNNAAAGLIVNGSTVTASGLTTSNNAWYGVNVDQGDLVDTLAKFVLESGNLQEDKAIFLDKGIQTGKTEVVVPAGAFHQVQFGNVTAYVNSLADGVYVQAKGAQAKSYTAYLTLNEAVAKAGEGDTIFLKGDQQVKKQVVIDKALTLKSFERTAKITPSADFERGDGKNDLNLLTIDAKDKKVVLEDLILEKSLRNGINVYLSSDVALKNVTSQQNVGAGLIVNGSNVSADKLSTSGNGWYGIGVDPGEGVTVKSSLDLTSGELDDPYAIVTGVGSDESLVSVKTPTAYVKHRIVGSETAYWTKAGAERLPGAYLKSGGNVTRYVSLNAAVGAAKDGDTVIVNGENQLASQLTITKAIHLFGEKGAKITKHKMFYANDTTTSNYLNHLVSINGVTGKVTLSDLTIDGAHASGLNVYQSKDVLLTNVTSTNNNNAGIIVNSSTVTADGVNTSGNVWYGINVDLGDGSKMPASLAFNSGTLAEAGQIISENYTVENGLVKVTATGYQMGSHTVGEKTFTYWTNRSVPNQPAETTPGSSTTEVGSAEER